MAFSCPGRGAAAPRVRVMLTVATPWTSSELRQRIMATPWPSLELRRPSPCSDDLQLDLLPRPAALEFLLEHDGRGGENTQPGCVRCRTRHAQASISGYAAVPHRPRSLFRPPWAVGWEREGGEGGDIAVERADRRKKKGGLESHMRGPHVRHCHVLQMYFGNRKSGAQIPKQGGRLRFRV